MWQLDKQDPVSGSLLLTHPGLDETSFPALAPTLLAALRKVPSPPSDTTKSASKLLPSKTAAGCKSSCCVSLRNS